MDRTRPSRSRAPRWFAVVVLLAAFAIAALALVTAGSAVFGSPVPPTAAQVVDLSRPSPDRDRRPSPTPRKDSAVLPTEAPGRELHGLPRYPGAVRVGYLDEVGGRVRTIRAQYQTAATLEDVRTFYRGVIAGGWVAGDARHAAGTSSFVLADGPREAVLVITESAPLVEVAIEHTEPLPEPTATAAPAPAARPPQAAVPPAPPPEPRSPGRPAEKADKADKAIKPDKADEEDEDDEDDEGDGESEDAEPDDG
jgi:hypothetical protein